MLIDWDSILAYNTIKIVRIRDKRLGILHLCFIVIIVLYVVVYSAIYKKGYLSTEEPVGSIRTSLWSPNTFKANQVYCKNNTEPYPYKKLECVYYDDALVGYPIGDDVGFTASSRMKISEQKSNCSLTDPTCKFYTNSSVNVYLADIESFTVLIDHTMYAPLSQIQFNGDDLSGYILDQNGNEIQINETVNVIGIEGRPDVLELGKILEFGGIDLDGPSMINSSNSIRYDGCVLFVFIEYSNTFSYDLNKIKYVYSIKKVDDTGYDIPEAIILDNPNSRLYYKRHAIRLIFIQTGLIGSFNFQSLLLTLVSGLGLLTVSTLIVDQLAIRFLPQRKSYSSFKFQTTESFKMKKRIVNDDGEDKLYHNIETL
ncbi:hypothetical protein RB653_002273 [Dictyostelium firmibasis]|uniref:P2X receptor n=1 Tax=Dictyostelium firmibasis TaxID=79012 RepID=A0AAN7TW55_9MYCE